MFKKKYKITNEELQLEFRYRSKAKALRVKKRLEKNMTPISFEDEWLLHDLDTGELVR